MPTGNDDAMLDRKVTFYDPHPGFGDAAAPLPTIVKRIADALDGQTLTLRAATACIQSVTPGQVFAHAYDGWIQLTVGGNGRLQHVWQVIRFR